MFFFKLIINKNVLDIVEIRKKFSTIIKINKYVPFKKTK
jgi:hypothetical protein